MTVGTSCKLRLDPISLGEVEAEATLRGTVAKSTSGQEMIRNNRQ